MLRLVPYVVRHPGERLADLARLFHVSEDDLVQDLNLLFMTGLPPYGPGDLVEVDIEDGRVWVSMADHFSRPVRLTRQEALALYLRGKALVGTPGLPESQALSSALARLEEGLGEETLGGLAGRVHVEAEGREHGEALPRAREAIAARERLRIEYYSANRDEVGERLIEPEHVFAALGNWYVVAWDVGADGERMFRLDRVRTLERTGETFEPRGLPGPGRPLYSPGEADIRVRLRLGPGARWVAEYYEVEVVGDGPDGLEVVLPTKELAWVAKLLLRLGGGATVIEPPELRDLARDLASRTLDAYR